MSSVKQIDANRKNAQKSTGPRSVEGRAAVRGNALKHGIFAESPAHTGEDSDAFARLKQSMYDRFQPATPDEEVLVASLVRNAWQLERCSNIETGMWDHQLDEVAGEPHPQAMAYQILAKDLNLLQRRIDAAGRNYRRDLELLLKLQKATQLLRDNALLDANGFVPPPCRQVVSLYDRLKIGTRVSLKPHPGSIGKITRKLDGWRIEVEYDDIIDSDTLDQIDQIFPD